MILTPDWVIDTRQIQDLLAISTKQKLDHWVFMSQPDQTYTVLTLDHESKRRQLNNQGFMGTQDRTYTVLTPDHEIQTGQLGGFTHGLHKTTLTQDKEFFS